MSVSSATEATENSSARVPRLDEEPEIIKFLRCDALQYEGDWAPEKYDADLAREILESSIEDAVEAERLGFDGVMTTEHHFDGWTIIPSPNVYLAALACRTSRLRLGQSVNILPFHNPWRLAEEVGMLDIISNGRVELGVGKGNFSIERDRYGLTLDDVDDRFNEGLELLTRALGEHSITFDGKYNRIQEPSTVYPKPFGLPLRPWVAALKPESIEKVGREGNNLYGFMSPAAAGDLQRYLEAAHEAGHERSGANYLTTTSIIIAPTDREAEEIQECAKVSAWETMIARGMPEAEAHVYMPLFGGGVVGSPQTVLDQLAGGLQMTGARRLNLVIRLRSIPKEESRQSMHLFAEEVMPHLRHLST
ncbi:LLM class flavin-dependent oxidoreductase [Pseudonocardia bannensis]|uniref:LLM class flavin-dependent oxidoreductase n=1 Tax=Pseudonocardia bannensis TaxID=630973 RepID=A0A848DNG1_9PSEU|nr:LLM class flavin-dependent oxidoreductase [Pseudonocardia bannensis]NMH94350.1 LLM class flavin-dependent oxidoreductase [Pseudonocardia bannensis]